MEFSSESVDQKKKQNIKTWCGFGTIDKPQPNPDEFDALHVFWIVWTFESTIDVESESICHDFDFDENSVRLRKEWNNEQAWIAVGLKKEDISERAHTYNTRESNTWAQTLEITKFCEYLFGFLLDWSLSKILLDISNWETVTGRQRAIKPSKYHSINAYLVGKAASSLTFALASSYLGSHHLMHPTQTQEQVVNTFRVNFSFLSFEVDVFTTPQIV